MARSRLRAGSTQARALGPAPAGVSQRHELLGIAGRQSNDGPNKAGAASVFAAQGRSGIIESRTGWRGNRKRRAALYRTMMMHRLDHVICTAASMLCLF